MAAACKLTNEQELACQTSFILASAVDALNPLQELKEKVRSARSGCLVCMALNAVRYVIQIEYHNLTDVNIIESGTLRALVALSSDTIQYGPSTKASYQVRGVVRVSAERYARQHQYTWDQHAALPR